MSSREELNQVLAEIIATGLLRIRRFGFENRADLCAIEADHIHNLPAILIDSRVELLAYYYEIERPAFVKRAEHSEQFEPFWIKLASILEAMRVARGQS
jgi:hypothetical protein